ncbi:hypothetical protein COF67_23685 [Bacillus toyonensis]|nr:hypothetical protein COF67_23685 [Bacillus toyonensis]
MSYGYENEKKIFEDFNLVVNQGDIVCIEGNNGCGKTTLLNCITGVINNFNSIYIFNQSVKSNTKLAKNISYVMNEDFLYDHLTVKENINYFKILFNGNSYYDNEIEYYMNILGINSYNNFLVKELSQGNRHKLYIAIMLSKEFEVLVLDEAFTSLDKNSQIKMLELVINRLENLKKTIIFVTHIEEFKKVSTRNIIL